MRKLYCGGTFCFDCQKENYPELAAADYRAMLLGSPERLLHKSDGVDLGGGVLYIGPFYFEADGMVDRDIVQSETDMVRACTDAIFLLDEAACPGTVCELTMASMLGKNVHLFYLRRPDSEETESSLHTPCWYPIIHSRIVNPNTRLYECGSREDAAKGIRALVQSWQQ